ncbi:hypothetical protein GCM10020219_008870 [Nonomuraea dietziae]
MLAAQSPAACQYYYSHLGLLIDLVVKALAPVLPGKAAAASYGDSLIVQFTGTDPRTGKLYVSQEATVGGWGAWEGGDGESALINNVNGSLRDMPIEVLETLFPVRVTRYEVRPDTGGQGQWRGGNGVVREYEFSGDTSLSLWFERSVTPAWGLAGGAAGAPPRVVLNPRHRRRTPHAQGQRPARQGGRRPSLRVRRRRRLRPGRPARPRGRRRRPRPGHDHSVGPANSPPRPVRRGGEPGYSLIMSTRRVRLSAP